MTTLRLVPKDPDPVEFPYVPWACSLAPARCGECTGAVCLRFAERPVPLPREGTSLDTEQPDAHPAQPSKEE